MGVMRARKMDSLKEPVPMWLEHRLVQKMASLRYWACQWEPVTLWLESQWAQRMVVMRAQRMDSLKEPVTLWL